MGQNPPRKNYETLVPDPDDEESFATTHLLCCEDEVMHVDPLETPCAWRCEFELPKGLSPEELQDWTSDDILLATTEKKQRIEVKLTTLNAEERKALEEAKDSEIQNWLKTGTVSKVLRSKLAPEQILRCRWVLVWKPREGIDPETNEKGNKLHTHKPKARLVVIIRIS